MSFMSVLKAIGKGALKAAGFAAPIASIAASGGIGGPFLSNILQKVLAAVGTAERAGELFAPGMKVGAQKGQLAASLVKELIAGAEGISGANIVDNEKFNRGVDAITAGVADILDAIEHKDAVTASQ